MMKLRIPLITFCLFIMAAVSVSANTGIGNGDRIVLGEELTPKDTSKVHRFRNHLIAPKGEWQCGLSVLYADFSSSDSDYMLMLQGVDASASLLRLAPEAAYTYANNHAIGARFQYTNINGMVDAATADLLGNLSMTVENINAYSRSISGSIYQRTYLGLDRYGRIGIFWDYVLGYTRTKSQFIIGEGNSPFSVKSKIHLGFAPGIVYFPLNNISIQACISLADISYSTVSAYESGALVGKRNAWKAQASLNVLNLSFGLTVHL